MNVLGIRAIETEIHVSEDKVEVVTRVCRNLLVGRYIGLNLLYDLGDHVDALFSRPRSTCQVTVNETEEPIVQLELDDHTSFVPY